MPSMADIAIPIGTEHAHAVLHDVSHAEAAVVMVGGAGGGTWGPSGSYPRLAERLNETAIAALRLDYREPNRLRRCVEDARSGIAYLTRRGVRRVALVGWSFGGAVVITAGAEDPAAVGVATIASQTAGTQDVGRLAPKALLLIHGTRDPVLPDTCSRQLYAQAGEPKDLVLYDGDGHGIERHTAALLDRLAAWCAGLLGGRAPGQEAQTVAG